MKTIFPPYTLLTKVLDHCPKAGSIYLKLFRDRQDTDVVFYEKSSITDECGISWKSFKSDLRLLRREGVIKFTFSKDDSKVNVLLLDPPELNEKAA